MAKNRIHVYEQMTDEQLLSAFEKAVVEAKETDVYLKCNIISEELLKRMAKNDK